MQAVRYYAGRFSVIVKIGFNAFKLELIMDLSELKVHNVFNVSQLKKYHSATTLIDQWESANLPPEEDLQAD